MKNETKLQKSNTCMNEKEKRTRMKLEGKKYRLIALKKASVPCYWGYTIQTSYLFLDVLTEDCLYLPITTSKQWISDGLVQNALLDSKGDIKCTECALDKLPVTDLQHSDFKALGFPYQLRFNAMVTHEVYTPEGEFMGYRVYMYGEGTKFYPQGYVVLMAQKGTYKFLNLRVIERKGKFYSSKIKGDLPKCTMSELAFRKRARFKEETFNYLLGGVTGRELIF